MYQNVPSAPVNLQRFQLLLFLFPKNQEVNWTSYKKKEEKIKIKEKTICGM